MSLAVLGYVSLRQWQASSELLFQEQSRNLASMAAEKVDMALRYAEDEILGRLEASLDSRGVEPEVLRALVAQTPLVARLALFERAGRRLYPPGPPDATGEALERRVDELGRGLWDRGGRRHLIIGDDLVLAAALRAPGRPPVLALLVHDPGAVREVLEKALAGSEGPAILAVTDHRDRPVYGHGGDRRTDLIATVPLGEALPSWRLALFQRAELSPRAAVRRQMILLARPPQPPRIAGPEAGV